MTAIDKTQIKRNGPVLLTQLKCRWFITEKIANDGKG